MNENFRKITNDTAEVIWKLITSPNPMLLHLRTTQDLKLIPEKYDESKVERRNSCEGSKNDYEIEAYAYPVLINSCGGKIIEKGSVFVHMKKENL